MSDEPDDHVSQPPADADADITDTVVSGMPAFVLPDLEGAEDADELDDDDLEPTDPGGDMGLDDDEDTPDGTIEEPPEDA